MISHDEIDNLENSIRTPQAKAIFKVLKNSYYDSLRESKQHHSWPADEYVKDSLWETEIALRAMMDNPNLR